MEAKCILLVEDEPGIARIEESYLKNAGYQVLLAKDGEEALYKFRNQSVDLVVLDLMLPKLPGEQVLAGIRANADTPVIIVSAKSDEEDRITGLRYGADDYLTKPFSPRELVERIRAILRRTETADEPVRATIVVTLDGRVQINLESMEVLKDGRHIHFTRNEFRILSTLFCHPNKIFTREEIIELTFGMEYESFDRAIDTHIKNIRQKLEDQPKKPVYIKTVYGVGYKAGGFNETPQ
ncbi:MAG: response regulator transcription factor [Ndongobacter sp.]|nr:response regulator transcription factor [Ndongobacter sp.]